MKSFLIFGQDNGQYAYNKEQAIWCSGCGILNRAESSRLPFTKLKYDFSSTYDNELVISERVYLELINYIDKSNFEKAGQYYYVLPEAIVEFDAVARKTKFGCKCSVCGKHSHVIGISPAYLKQTISKSGLYATDLSFGDVADENSNQTPGIILSEDLLKIVLSLNASGINYEPTIS